MLALNSIAGYRHSSRTVRWQTASCQDRGRGGFWDRETDLQNLRSRHVRHSPAKLLLLAMEGCLFQKAERKLPLQPKGSPIATEFVPARTQGYADDLDVAHRNSSDDFGRGTPKQQQRRPTRVRFCRLGPLDRTRLRCRTTVPQLVSRPDQRPPSGQRQFRTRTRPPEHGHRITDTRTAPCLNARGCWIYQGRGPAQEVPLPQQHPAEWSIAPEGVHLANRCACSESLGRTRLATLLQV